MKPLKDAIKIATAAIILFLISLYLYSKGMEHSAESLCMFSSAVMFLAVVIGVIDFIRSRE